MAFVNMLAEVGFRRNEQSDECRHAPGQHTEVIERSSVTGVSIIAVQIRSMPQARIRKFPLLLCMTERPSGAHKYCCLVAVPSERKLR